MQGADPPEPHGPYWLWTANINGRRYRRPAISTTRSTPVVIGRCALTAASADRSSDSGACRACPEEPHPNDMAAWNAGVLPYTQDIPLRIQGVLLEAVLSATLGEDDRVVVGRHDEDGFLRSCAAPWWRGTRFGQVTGGATARV